MPSYKGITARLYNSTTQTPLAELHPSQAGPNELSCCTPCPDGTEIEIHLSWAQPFPYPWLVAKPPTLPLPQGKLAWEVKVRVNWQKEAEWTTMDVYLPLKGVGQHMLVLPGPLMGASGGYAQIGAWKVRQAPKEKETERAPNGRTASEQMEAFELATPGYGVVEVSVELVVVEQFIPAAGKTSKPVEDESTQALKAPTAIQRIVHPWAEWVPIPPIPKTKPMCKLGTQWKCMFYCEAPC